MGDAVIGRVRDGAGGGGAGVGGSSRRTVGRAVVLVLVGAIGSVGVAAASVGGDGFQLILGWVVALCVLVALWPAGTRVADAPWWLNPMWLAPMAVAPGLLMVAVTPPDLFADAFGAPKLLTGDWALLVVLLTLCVMLGAFVGQSTARERPALARQVGPQTAQYIARAAVVLFWLTVAGYVLWALVGASRGVTPVSALSAVFGGGVSRLKDQLHPVAGVTTLTQFGAPAVAMLMIAVRTGSWISPRRARRYLIALVVLALVRSFVYAERLALLEIVVPMIVVAFGWPRRPRGASRRLLVTVLPLLAPVALLMFFGTFEYLRSWSSDYYRAKYAGRSYSEFVVTRVESYYATALNNGVIINENDNRLRPIPWFTLRGAWDFPLTRLYVDYPELAGVDVSRDYADTLKFVANPEFNNQSGVLLPVYDLGRPGAAAYWLLVGALLGRAYRLFRRRDPVGLVVFPSVFIGIAELGRILYWPTGRALPGLAAALIVGYAIRRRMAADAAAGVAADVAGAADAAEGVAGAPAGSAGAGTADSAAANGTGATHRHLDSPAASTARLRLET